MGHCRFHLFSDFVMDTDLSWFFKIIIVIKETSTMSTSTNCTSNAYDNTSSLSL